MTDELLAVERLVEQPTTWTGDEIGSLPLCDLLRRIHYVTTRPKLGVTFAGVSADTLLEAAAARSPWPSRAR